MGGLGEPTATRVIGSGRAGRHGWSFVVAACGRAWGRKKGRMRSLLAIGSRRDRKAPKRSYHRWKWGEGGVVGSGAG